MDLNTYEAEISKFDSYPEDKRPMIYFLGLGGENSEFAEKINLTVSDSILRPTRDDMVFELGDVLWYMSRIISSFGFTLLDIYKKATNKSIILVLDKEDVDLLISNKLNVSVGKLQERMKKIIRDEGGVIKLKDNRIEDLSVSVIRDIILIAEHLDTTISEVAEMNYKKLKSRQKRGTIPGDGDDR